MTLRYVDTSAWHRSTNRGVLERWRAALDADEVGICDQVRLEILYSARSGDDYERLRRELGALRTIPIGEHTYRRACAVQQELAHVAGLHHRSVQIADLLIAAAAESAGEVVWHYDADYDRIAAITGQAVEWIVPRGSL